MTAMRSLPGRPASRSGTSSDGASRAPAPSDSQIDGDEHHERLAGFLGWFSIGLGLTQVLAPRGFARFIGVRDDESNRALVRLVGLRELTSGVGILTRPRPAGWVWARVAGDAMDLAMLGSAFSSPWTDKGRVATATAAVVGVMALDVYDGLQLSRPGDPTTARERSDRGVDVKRSITLNRPVEGLYRFWHDFQNLPQFMSHLESVQVTGDRRSHWKAKAPAGKTVEWDAEITEDVPNERIAWRSLEGADVDNSGSVRFVPAPGGRGTEVHVELRYNPPGGSVGAWIARLFGEEPGQQVGDDLRHFKQVMETGEVVLSGAGFDASRQFQRPAQPAASVTRR